MNLQTPDLAIQLAGQLGTDVGATFIPDTPLDMNLVPGWDRSMAWCLVRVWTPTVIAVSNQFAIIGVDMAGRSGPPIPLRGSNAPMELVQYAPVPWDGTLTIRTSTKLLQASLPAVGTPPTMTTFGWPATSAVFLTLQFYGWKIPAMSGGCQ